MSDPEATRLQKLSRLRELGHDPYAAERFDTTAFPDEIRDRYEELEGQQVSLAGRITALREMGKAAFFDITRYGERLDRLDRLDTEPEPNAQTTPDDPNESPDAPNAQTDPNSKLQTPNSSPSPRIQVYIKKDDVGEDLWEVFQQFDIGDIVGVTGEVFKTRTGEVSIHARNLQVLAKSLHTLPLGKEKEGHQWYGLTDVEERYRRRYLDLLANPDSRQTLVSRARVVSLTRRFLDERGYLEVETPVLQTEAGGAAARPFLTHHNALDIELKLRISLELFLKRVIIGGIDKVYEIGRVFRNEGISTKHNPEFTMLELYHAYADMEDIQSLVEDLCRCLAIQLTGSPTIDVRLPISEPNIANPSEIENRKSKIDFSRPWARIDLLSAVEEHAGVPPSAFNSLETALEAMRGLGLPTEKEVDVGGIIEKLLEKFVEPHLIQPTFVENYPIETSPLAKRHPKNPRLTRRFEGYVLGRELCNAFSELNDPLDQRQRMEIQQAQLLAGDHEANPLDEDFLYAMECAMPPTGGLGIGMDRLAMLFTAADSIRDVILFPTLRPEG